MWFNSFHLFLFWLWWVFAAVWASRLQTVGAALRCGAWASHCSGLSRRRAWALVAACRSRAWAQQPWHMDLVPLRRVGSSLTGGRTCVPCITRQILNLWTTREALSFHLLLFCNLCITLHSKWVSHRQHLIDSQFLKIKAHNLPFWYV